MLRLLTRHPSALSTVRSTALPELPFVIAVAISFRTKSVIPKGQGLICIPHCTPVAVLSIRRSYEISQVPDQPSSVSAVLVDPGRIVPPDHTEVQCCSCYCDDKSSSIGQFRGSVTRLLQSLPTLRDSVALHAQDLLPTGGQPLSGEIGYSPG